MDKGDKSKAQPNEIAVPEDAPSGSIISPDTCRSQRIPPGQSRTKKWPVLDAGGPPRISLDAWSLKIHGMVDHLVEWNWG
jgi:DMSO/TMAO reductase YedYZ molybdopterin-dependent catalytic subunit